MMPPPPRPVDEKMLSTADRRTLSTVLRSTDDAPPTKNRETLPKFLAGTVQTQFVRCNRPGCRCAAGRLHGPYFYRFWREAGRLRKEYVPQNRLAEVRAACTARVQFARDLSASRKAARRLVADLEQKEA